MSSFNPGGSDFFDGATLHQLRAVDFAETPRAQATTRRCEEVGFARSHWRRRLVMMEWLPRCKTGSMQQGKGGRAGADGCFRRLHAAGSAHMHIASLIVNTLEHLPAQGYMLGCKSIILVCIPTPTSELSLLAASAPSAAGACTPTRQDFSAAPSTA